MENDYSSFIEKGDDGSIKSFDESKLTSYIDSCISKGVESYKAKVQKEQETAKLTEEEKLTKEREDFENLKREWEQTMKSQKRDLVVEKAKAKLSSKFSETEIKLLTSNVTDDEKTSMKYIDDLIAERDKFLEESKNKIMQELQSKQPRVTSNQQSEQGFNNHNDKTAIRNKMQNIKNIYK